MNDQPTAVASCRLSPVERELLEASAARAEEQFISVHLREIVRGHLREEFGPGVLGEGSEDGGGE